MSAVEAHYERQLAAIFPWVVGGVDTALKTGEAEVTSLNLPRTAGDLVLDLGAGFGMHAIPLAHRGARVVAIDSSQVLIDMLVANAPKESLQTVVGDLLGFQQHIVNAPAAILCMGDTITHLPDFTAVQQLVEHAAAALRIGGLFVATFRDYTLQRAGDERFIPVRGDNNRTLTCFLEYAQDVVQIYDILNERGDDGWKLRVSHYPKLRLAPSQLIQSLELKGFQVQRDTAPNGMVRLVAERVR